MLHQTITASRRSQRVGAAAALEEAVVLRLLVGFSRLVHVPSAASAQMQVELPTRHTHWTFFCWGTDLN
jgi:hypothetical protein